MGLLDEIAGMAGMGGGQGGGAGGDPTQGGGTMGAGGAAGPGAIGAILGALQSHPGGLGGILSSLQQAGLGDQAGSWVGTGPNQPISPDQAQSALGGGFVGQIASKLGIPPALAATAVSQYLPQIIDHLTSNGQVPQDNGVGGLGGLLSRLGR